MPDTPAFLFFANLSDDNATTLSADAGAREAVLLSPNTAARRAKQAAQVLRAKGLALAADNGNTAVIFKVVKEFAEQAAALAKERPRSLLPPNLAQPTRNQDDPDADAFAAERGQEAKVLLRRAFNATARQVNKAIPKPAASSTLKARYTQLAKQVATRCGDLLTAEQSSAVLSAQAEVQPGFFTCLEDLTVPILTLLDVNPEDTSLTRSTYVSWQGRGLRQAQKVLAGAFGPVSGLPYATVHAIDYDSAVEVGKRAAKVNGVMGLATGLASYLNDPSYVNHYRLQGETIWTHNQQNIPRRYVQTLLVTLGLLDGFKAVRGSLPRFHGLGAGAPLIIMLLTLCGYGSPLLSIDSTAPEKNASMGKLFVLADAPLTVSVEKLARAWIKGDTHQSVYPLNSPAITSFLRQHPFDLARARKTYQDHIAPRPVELRDLNQSDGLGKALPLFWEGAPAPLKRTIMAARTNHNQWVMQQLAIQLRNEARSYTSLRKWVGQQCQAYQASTTPVFALQVDECLKLIDRLRS